MHLKNAISKSRLCSMSNFHFSVRILYVTNYTIRNDQIASSAMRSQKLLKTFLFSVFLFSIWTSRLPPILFVLQPPMSIPVVMVVFEKQFQVGIASFFVCAAVCGLD